ncbi:thiol:disulfide interchange protein DsbA/DsbL [Campylobacter sp. 2018MI35]|uniref:thiol:disulfide interchange protein DsbA/DsbL n=1 Tax=Campylobacter sp. 2018MI34 TaxID=2800582 RepID=UPI0019053462|nr:thiol:disulfide interchange protein DsbA/DsbL [Campylobacter sp. 2018MI34]MBK1991308.1 thiol:disulfide interchange protein DsbA/DsbL [Campylobacter sp. 2018MI34]
MKVFSKIVKFSTIAVFLLHFNASALTEGKEYIVLHSPIPSVPNSVIEVFSYRCTHCYDHHKFNTLEKIKEKLPNLNYSFYPVSSMGDYGKQANEVFAFAYAKDKENNIDSTDQNSFTYKVADAYFSAYFKKKERWENGENPEAFYDVGLKAMGVTKNDLEIFLKTDEANKILKSYEYANDISKNYGTPGFVVNGKYQITPQAITSPQALIKAIEELSKL